jgi:rhodanese-related sulfurtransferase
VKKVTFEDVPQALKDEDKLVLDVRRNSERKSSHIVGSIHIPLHQLEEKVNSLPKDKEIWVHCAGAYRASAAVGLLERADLHPLLINEPYEKALIVPGLKITSEGVDTTPVAPSDLKNQTPKLPA